MTFRAWAIAGSILALAVLGASILTMGGNGHRPVRNRAASGEEVERTSQALDAPRIYAGGERATPRAEAGKPKRTSLVRGQLSEFDQSPAARQARDRAGTARALEARLERRIEQLEAKAETLQGKEKDALERDLRILRANLRARQLREGASTSEPSRPLAQRR